MEQEKTRRRAPGMTGEQRRAMIVQAALPLVARLGPAVTTLQIAQAAGIGEATIFRAFADKAEVLEACVLAALRNDDVLAELAGIRLDQPLAARLIEAATALTGYLDRLGTILSALPAAHDPGLPEQPRGLTRPSPGALPDRAEAAARTQQALVRLFEPDRASLRRPPEVLAELFGRLLVPPRGLATARVMSTVEDAVDLFLHGAVGA